MKIKFSSHSLKRIKERNITKKEIIKAVKFSDKIEVSRVNKNRFLIKKKYHHRKFKKDHLLMIICEKKDTFLEIITVIDTSKISKYF